jgi:nitrite reductase/ring-hydroxylating ferredoxin subunit
MSAKMIGAGGVMTGSDRGAESAWVYAGNLEELKARGMTIVQAHRGPLLVICDGSGCFAVDNRCPHLGFPLHRGSVADGILTCHWHHARFDVASGGGFDLWADDLPTAEVQVRGGEVWVTPEPRYADGEAHWKNRLCAGLEHNLALVIAKAILGLRMQGIAPHELVREAALFGARHREHWGTGLTVLAALANLIRNLPDDATYLALYKGIRNVAEDCEGQPARHARQPLDKPVPAQTLARWLRHWTAVRHPDAAERTLLTAIHAESAPAELAELMLVAATDRVYADGGHALDFINKAFELLEHIGWQHASAILPTTTSLLTSARGAEESNAWRHPVDLIAVCADAANEAPAAIAAGCDRRGTWKGTRALVDTLLGDSAHDAMHALIAAVREGALLSELGGALAYAAALRIARFGTANEHSDWEAAHHAFTYANALHRMLIRLEAGGRVATAETLRGLLHGAMSLYLLRFLNVPPAKLPGEARDRLDDLPEDGALLCEQFLDALDRHGALDLAPRYVARYLTMGRDPERLLATLAQAVLREDAGFHTYQMLEAATGQFRYWSNGPEGRHILVASARYLAAHSPTERGELQTATVARKLARGQRLYAEE